MALLNAHLIRVVQQLPQLSTGKVHGARYLAAAFRNLHILACLCSAQLTANWQAASSNEVWYISDEFL